MLSLLTFVAALPATSCTTAADEQVLNEFFTQSQVYDRTRLAQVATVVFDPRIDGVVTGFEIVERRPERPLPSGGVAREVVLQASVRSAAGATSQRTLVVTMEQHEGRWRITRIKQGE